MAEPSGSPKITRVRPKWPPADLERRVSELGLAAARGDAGTVRELLQRIVPTYTPQPLWAFLPGGPAAVNGAAALVGEAGMATVPGLAGVASVGVPQTASVQFVSRAELAPPKAKVGSHRVPGKPAGAAPAPPGPTGPSAPSVVPSGAQAAPQR